MSKRITKREARSQVYYRIAADIEHAVANGVELGPEYDEESFSVLEDMFIVIGRKFYSMAYDLSLPPVRKKRRTLRQIAALLEPKEEQG